MIKLLLLVLINIHFGVTLIHQKALAKKLWTEHCDKNTHVLNDCNWCWCDGNNHYACQARHCAQVDMYGHFNDAVDALDVGMEGHGAWRSSKTSCTPGVSYSKGNLLCLCSENGNWPNPVCRDSFQILHSIQRTNYTRPRTSQSCAPSKLHLIGCNVCLCPSSGYIDPKLCTHDKCQEIPDMPSEESSNDPKEIYATCNPEDTYKMGRTTCTCLSNNRLLCESSIKEDRSPSRRSSCLGRRPWVTFEIDCNICVCDDEDTTFCTNNDCSLTHVRQGTYRDLPNKFMKNKFACTPGSKWKKDCNYCQCLANGIPKCTLNRCDSLKKRPSSIFKCVPNTSWKDDCNNCRCLPDGSPICTMKSCNVGDPSKNGERKLDCVPGTKWIVDCNRCKCNTDGKTATCSAKRCVSPKAKEEPKINPFQDVYQKKCKPGKMWKKGCNTCKCSDDGATISCTAKQCLLKSTFDKLVSSVNVNRDSLREINCRKGQLFEVDCNFCYCMDYGDLICTTRSCNDEVTFLE